MESLIFDVDGTLIDSYASIIDRLQRALKHFDLKYSDKFIYKYIIKKSTSDFIEYACEKHHINKYDFFFYHSSLPSDLDIINLYDGVEETLNKFWKDGVKLFIFTHRGKTLDYILKRLGIKKYFDEIVDSTCDFKRKPNGEAINYLIKKYRLDPDNCFYVGDREIDMLCAQNAHIKSIFFNTSGIDVKTPYTFKIDKFDELIDIINKTKKSSGLH